MRWVAVLVLLALPTMSPVFGAESLPDGRDEDVIGAIAPSEVIVHQNETVSTYITVQNKANANQALTVEVLSVPEPLTVLGLPLSEIVVPNHLRQLTFSIKANATAAFQNHTVSFSVSSDLEGAESKTISMNVIVAPWSNLNFGAQGVSQLTVDEKVRTSVAMNLSNNGTMADNVSFSLSSNSGWAWGWDMQNIVDGTAHLLVQPGQLVYAYFWVDVPAIQNGMPLFETGPRFTLTATSSLDRAAVQWSVDLMMNEKKNATIDAYDPLLEVAPNQDGRLYAVVRNVGNTPNTLNITLQPLDENGGLLPGSSPSDRFTEEGWVVALFGGLEDIVLQPNESRTVEIGFQAPNEFEGGLSIQLQVFANGASTLLRTATMTATINRTASASASYSENGCNNILSTQPCSVSISVLNTGNSYNTYLLRLGEVTDGFEVALPANTMLVQQGQTKTFAPLSVGADEGSVAFMTGLASIEVLGDAGTVLDTVSVPLVVGPEINWTFRNVAEQVNARGRLTIAMEARNDGNAVDGLIVQLQSSHVVDMGFIPPENAVYEEDVEFPRSFEINDVPLNSNFTIRAWVQLPQDQVNNGTVTITTSIRSRYAPELPFIHTSTGDYLGQAWQPVDEEDAGIDWGGMASTAVLYLKAWSGVLLAIVFASLVIYKAVIDRDRRLEQQNVLPYQEKSAEDDWMARYQKEPTPVEEPEPPREPLQAVPKETYEAMFRHAHGQASQPQSPVDDALVSAATLVLDKRTEDISKAKANDVLLSLQNQGVILSPTSASEPVPTTVLSDVQPLQEKMTPSNQQPEDDLEF